MKVKDVDLKKLEQLLQETDDELYLVSITFDGSEPVLNLYKPFDDSELRQQKYQAALSGIMDWIKDMDKRNNFV